MLLVLSNNIGRRSYYIGSSVVLALEDISVSGLKERCTDIQAISQPLVGVSWLEWGRSCVINPKCHNFLVSIDVINQESDRGRSKHASIPTRDYDCPSLIGVHLFKHVED